MSEDVFSQPIRSAMRMNFTTATAAAHHDQEKIWGHSFLECPSRLQVGLMEEMEASDRILQLECLQIGILTDIFLAQKLLYTVPPLMLVPAQAFSQKFANLLIGYFLPTLCQPTGFQLVIDIVS